jgi:hypothetical protein
MRYQSPPSTSQATVDAYNSTLLNVTQANLQTGMVPVQDWWKQISFGTQELQVTVLPAVSLPGNPLCAWPTMRQQAWDYAATQGFQNVSSFDAMIAIAPYSCWSSKGSTGGKWVNIWNTIGIEGKGLIAHELGHALGMLHNGSMSATGVVTEYGSIGDQMGAGSDFFTLRNLNGDHKVKMGMATSKACVSTTLKSIQTYPEVIQCGTWFITYAADYRNVVTVAKRGYVSGAGGGDDTVDYAWLAVGQSYQIPGGQLVKHVTGGQIVIQ